MENNRFDRALNLVSLVTVSGNKVRAVAGNAVLVSKGDAAERMTHLLPEFTLNDFSRGVFVVLERFAHVGQKPPRDEIIALDRNATAERTLQNIRDGDALSRTGVQMFHEGHVDVAGQERELDRTQF